MLEYTVKKQVISLNIIVYYPETPKKQAEFDACAAKFHAEYVTQYIEKLNCPTGQKIRLLDAVAKTILEGIEEKGTNNI
jgi:hypothetical protein